MNKDMAYELARQAIEQTEDQLAANGFQWNDLSEYVEAVDEEYDVNFAEIIVKECANIIQDFVDHRFPASEYPSRLKQYFNID